MITQTQPITGWTTDKFVNCQVDLGRSYPPEFVEALTLKASRVFRAWLEASGATEDALDLYDLIAFLNLALQNPGDGNAYLLSVEIPHTLQVLVKFGSDFNLEE